MSLFCSKISHGSQLPQHEKQVFTMAQKSLHSLVPIPFLASFPVTLPITHCSQPHWPICCSVNMSGTFPLQSLYTCCSHCFEHSSSQIIWWLAYPLTVCSNVTSLENHSLTSISSLIRQHFLSPYLALCLMFFYKELIANWLILYLFIVISVCLSSVDCKLHKAGTFVLFTIVSPMPRKVPRTVHSNI